MSHRRRLSFDTVQACADDLQQLHRGHTSAGTWSLPQACWHLKQSMLNAMNPSADESARIRPLGWLMLQAAMLVGRLPINQPSPSPLVPPIKSTPSAIDELLAVLPRFAAHRGPLRGTPGRRPVVRAGQSTVQSRALRPPPQFFYAAERLRLACFQRS